MGTYTKTLTLDQMTTGLNRSEILVQGEITYENSDGNTPKVNFRKNANTDEYDHIAALQITWNNATGRLDQFNKYVAECLAKVHDSELEIDTELTDIWGTKLYDDLTNL